MSIKYGIVCEKVNRGTPADVERLAVKLHETYPGSMPKGECRALAIVIAMTHDGCVSGFWGQCEWTHANGQFDSGDVVFSWVT